MIRDTRLASSASGNNSPGLLNLAHGRDFGARRAEKTPPSTPKEGDTLASGDLYALIFAAREVLDASR